MAIAGQRIQTIRYNLSVEIKIHLKKKQYNQPVSIK